MNSGKSTLETDLVLGLFGCAVAAIVIFAFAVTPRDQPVKIDADVAAGFSFNRNLQVASSNSDSRKSPFTSTANNQNVSATSYMSPSKIAVGNPITPATNSQKAGSQSTSSGQYYDYNYRPPVGEHYVQGYYRNGTYVSGHYQTNADDSFWNNWGSKGNINPYTTRVGSKTPPAFPSTRRR